MTKITVVFVFKNKNTLLTLWSIRIIDSRHRKRLGFPAEKLAREKDFKVIVGHSEDYLNASPKNNIVNKGLAGGKRMIGVDMMFKFFQFLRVMMLSLQ